MFYPFRDPALSRLPPPPSERVLNYAHPIMRGIHGIWVPDGGQYIQNLVRPFARSWAFNTKNEANSVDYLPGEYGRGLLFPTVDDRANGNSGPTTPSTGDWVGNFGTGSFTVAVLVQAPNYNPGAHRILTFKGSNPNISFATAGWYLEANNGTVIGGVADGTNSVQLGSQINGTLCGNGRTYLCALTVDRDSQLLSAFVDGTLSYTPVSVTSIGSVSGTSRPAWGGSSSSAHDGLICTQYGLFMWSRALRPAELKQLRNNPWMVFEEPVWWNPFASAVATSTLFRRSLTTRTGSRAA